MLTCFSLFPSSLAFGVVHAARDKRDTHGHGKRHYAVKLTTHHTLLSAARKHGNSEMGKWIDGPNEQIHYIPGEAIWMLFLRNSERFPAIDSVYTHGQIQAIVMSAAIDYNPDREVRPSLMRPKQSEYPATTGKDLVEGKQTHLSERDVQKIASQIVEAFVYLLDMDLGHDDFGLQNFAVSEKLDVSCPVILIDCVYLQSSIVTKFSSTDRFSWLTYYR